jgi:hypothetical protein
VSRLPLERTDAPGIYRRGSRYVVVYRVEGRQRKQSADTLAEARAIKLERDGEARALRRGPTLHGFSLSWLDRYAGTSEARRIQPTPASQTSRSAVRECSFSTNGAGGFDLERRSRSSWTRQGLRQARSRAWSSASVSQAPARTIACTAEQAATPLTPADPCQPAATSRNSVMFVAGDRPRTVAKRSQFAGENGCKG